MPYPKGLGAELIRGVEWGDDAARFVRGPGGLMALLLVKSLHACVRNYNYRQSGMILRTFSAFPKT